MNRSAALRQPKEKFDAAFKLYLLFLVSFFIHIPARLPVLGIIRMDLLLIAGTFFAMQSAARKNKAPRNAPKEKDDAGKWILAIIVLAVVTLPLVEWPGSVIRHGFELFIKAAIFYFFTVKLVDTERKLQWLIAAFLCCNVFRVVEPVFLHVTTGYWGDKTYLGDGEFAMRLSGAPSDIVNSNGLAFIIASVFPFLHYLLGTKNFWSKMLYLVLVGVLLFGMKLTLSRTGFLAVLIIAGGIIRKSKQKALLLTGLAIVGIIYFASLDQLARERYLSISDHSVRGGDTSQGRLDGIIDNIKYAMHRPIFGHGLGTSVEVNFHNSGHAQPAHNLYAEILQELGFAGLICFIGFIIAVVKNFSVAKRYMANAPPNDYLSRLIDALQVWILMNFLFSFASYGLTSYEWYLFGGLSVVVAKIAKIKYGALATTSPEPATRGRTFRGR